MRKAVLFDVFSSRCQFFNIETAGGNGCDHPEQMITEKENGKEVGSCHCHTCPLGIEAEQQDLTDREDPDAVKDEIEWDGVCEDGEVIEGECLLVPVDGTASEEQKQAMYSYERYMHRYDKQWLDAHGTKTHLQIIDELHEYGTGRQQDNE